MNTDMKMQSIASVTEQSGRMRLMGVNIKWDFGVIIWSSELGDQPESDAPGFESRDRTCFSKSRSNPNVPVRTKHLILTLIDLAASSWLIN